MGSGRQPSSAKSRKSHGRGGVWVHLIVLVNFLLVGAAGPVGATETSASGGKDWRDHVTLTLSDRVRGEFVDWFDPRSKTPSGTAIPEGAERYNFFANQLRVGVKLSFPHVLFTLEGQDTRLVNLPDDATWSPNPGTLGPGGLYFLNTRDRDQGEVFLKQGNLTLSDIPNVTGVSATLGRFEYGDGLETMPADPALAWLKQARISQRLVGPFGYTHVTRSMDGARLAYDTPDLNVTALGSRPTQGGFEVSANKELDIWLAGLALTLKKIENLAPLDARLFYLYYRDGRDDAVKVDNRPLDLRKADTRAIGIHTWGAHAVSVVDAGPGKLDGLLWGAVQTGDWGDLDHSGWAWAVEGGYQVPKLFAQPWLRFGYSRSSGDDDNRNGTHATFFQMLPTARVYAQFPFFNLMNNQDFFGQLILKPHSKVTVRTDYHWLVLTEKADQWYSGGGATNSTVFGFAGLPTGGQRKLSNLIDVSVTVAILKQLSAYAYYGHAIGNGVIETTFENADADYGYVELAYKY